MSERNAQFAIFSAADPRRHRLRWILIEASFLQGNEELERDASTGNENAFPSDLVDTRDVSAIKERIPSSMENRNNSKKEGKRSLQEPLANFCEIKRQKIEDDNLCPGETDNDDNDDSMSNEDDDDDDMIYLGTSSNQQTSQYDRRVSHHSSDFGESSSSRRRSLDSAHNDQDFSQDEMYPSDLGETGDDRIQNDTDTILLNESCQSQDMTQEDKSDYSKYLEGTSDVTKAIVDLWMKYKKISGSSLNVREEIAKRLAEFTSNQLNERDKRGYTPLLKACSLPSMSPHVMKYLMGTKIDVTCQLPADFDRHRPAGEGLIPGMSALSVAIKCRNVSLVQIFKKQEKEKLIKIEDEDGNTALHHSILTCSKSAFRALFPLFEPKDGREMLNKEGKSPLEIALEMESSGMSKGKQEDNIRFMIKEMNKNKNGNLEKYLSPRSKIASTAYGPR